MLRAESLCVSWGPESDSHDLSLCWRFLCNFLHRNCTDAHPPLASGKSRVRLKSPTFLLVQKFFSLLSLVNLRCLNTSHVRATFANKIF